MAQLLIFWKVCKHGGYKKIVEPNVGFVTSNQKILGEVVVLGTTELLLNFILWKVFISLL